MQSNQQATERPGDPLRDLFAVLTPATGDDFFRSLVDHLATVCAVDFAMVGRLVPPGVERVATIAVSRRGSPIPNVEFDLAGTPCEKVVAKTLCYFASGVADAFPQDRFLVEAGVQSYMGTPLFARDGAPLGVVALLHTAPMSDPGRIETILRLVADRTAAELERSAVIESLRASEARLSAVIDGSPGVAVQWYDRTGRVLRWNRGSERMFGFTSAEALGRTLDELIHTPEEMRAFVGALAEIERTGTAIGPNEYVFRRRNGESGTCWSTIFPIPGQGDAPWFVCMDVDVSHEKQAEAERRDLEEQVRHAQKLESLGVLAGGIAHDFNNLLTSILGHVNLMASHVPPTSPLHDMLGEVEVAARRAAELTRQMLAYAGRGKFVLQSVCLADLVGELAQLLQAAVSKRVGFRRELQPATILGDATQIRQVVMNLITNAAEALDGRTGTVVVRTGCRHMTSDELQSRVMQASLAAGDYAFLEVEDDGTGMDDQTLARIFDPFFTTKFTGRGLGLAAVIGIVRGHGGLIQVETEPERGSRFRVLIPAAKRVATSTAAPPLPAPEGRRGRILVVDDEESVRRVTRRVLERACFDVVEAPDGPAGIDLVAADPGSLDAALIDLTMPRMDGWEVVQRLRDIAPGMALVLMSGYSDPRPEVTAEAEATVAFVQKPFLTEELLDVLRQAIARPGRS